MSKTISSPILNIPKPTIPKMSPSLSLTKPIPQLPSQDNIKKLSSGLEVRISGKESEIKDYNGLISNSSLENELVKLGYVPLTKIVVSTENGQKRTQYIKAINKKGQKVFIMVDVAGFTSIRSTDLTLIESNDVTMVPYSIKTGAYTCASKEVCGVAFECGPDAICLLTREQEDMTPKEANFVFTEEAIRPIEDIRKDGNIMIYPVIRLSEIRANPELILSNTDIVTRRLRNATYTSELRELSQMQEAIINLNKVFGDFNAMREDIADKLNKTLTQLEKWNDIYIAKPPQTDEEKDKYRKLQYNMIIRNDGITTLLRTMKKVSEKRIEIEQISKEINDITEFCKKKFLNIEYANSE